MFLYYFNASILKIKKIFQRSSVERSCSFVWFRRQKVWLLQYPTAYAIVWHSWSIIQASCLHHLQTAFTFYMNIPQVNIHRRKHPRPWSRRLLYVIHFFFLFLWWTIQTSIIISRLHVYSWLNLYKLLLTINGCLALNNHL
jgi:hypothetical protein